MTGTGAEDGDVTKGKITTDCVGWVEELAS